MSSLQVHKSGFLKTQSGVKRIEMQDLRIFPLTLTSKGMGSMTARSQVISHTDSEENPDLGALRSSSAFFHFVRAEPGSSAAGLSYVIHRTSRAQISPITSHFFLWQFNIRQRTTKIYIFTCLYLALLFPMYVASLISCGLMKRKWLSNKSKCLSIPPSTLAFREGTSSTTGSLLLRDWSTTSLFSAGISDSAPLAANRFQSLLLSHF